MVKKKPKDYYKILGVSTTATDQEIKSAYRSLARKYHPDVNQGNKTSENLFKDIREAYDHLIDEKKRYLVDLALGIKTLDDVKNTSFSQKAPPPNDTKSKQSNTTTEKNRQKASENKKDKEPNLGDTFSSLFETILKSKEQSSKNASKLKGSPKFTTNPPPIKDAPRQKATSQKSSQRGERGEDITLDVYLMADEALNGAIKTIHIEHFDPCKKCDGTGIIAGLQCYECKGQGEKSNRKKLDVKIPAGIKNGSKVRIAKEGNRGTDENNPGDLYLSIKIYNPSSFEFNDNDTVSEIALAPHEAILGSDVQVLTVDGFVKMKIPPGTQLGQKFRLARQGLPNKTGERGDHFVIVKIEVPTEVSQREKELYEEIARISKFNPREYIN